VRAWLALLHCTEAPSGRRTCCSDLDRESLSSSWVAGPTTHVVKSAICAAPGCFPQTLAETEMRTGVLAGVALGTARPAHLARAQVRRPRSTTPRAALSDGSEAAPQRRTVMLSVGSAAMCALLSAPSADARTFNVEEARRRGEQARWVDYLVNPDGSAGATLAMANT